MCGSSWSFADRPLVPDRIVFNWHNFLSGCSTWNESDWNRWTEDAQKLGYNGIMVHAYGNNPMVSFTYNGKTKPVGYLSTTASGFGVIHWMTRPFDLFFASHSRQVFEKTRNEPLRSTCEQMGGKELGEYLFHWVTEAPQFARETSDFFIDKPLANVSNVLAGCRQRLAMIRDAKGDLAEYFRGLEQFMASFYETHDLLQRSQDALKKSNEVR